MKNHKKFGDPLIFQAVPQVWFVWWYVWTAAGWIAMEFGRGIYVSVDEL